MDTYTLLRNDMKAEVTLGDLLRPSGEVLCQTLELPWDNNDPDISCIPPGTYLCVPHDSPEHPKTWELTGVPGRTDILIHNGNTVKDTKGCICVGSARGKIDGEDAVLNSDATLDMLRDELPEKFMLDVQE